MSYEQYEMQPEGWYGLPKNPHNPKSNAEIAEAYCTYMEEYRAGPPVSRKFSSFLQGLEIAQHAEAMGLQVLFRARQDDYSDEDRPLAETLNYRLFEYRWWCPKALAVRSVQQRSKLPNEIPKSVSIADVIPWDDIQVVHHKDDAIQTQYSRVFPYIGNLSSCMTDELHTDVSEAVNAYASPDVRLVVVCLPDINNPDEMVPLARGLIFKAPKTIVQSGWVHTSMYGDSELLKYYYKYAGIGRRYDTAFNEPHWIRLRKVKASYDEGRYLWPYLDVAHCNIHDPDETGPFFKVLLTGINDTCSHPMPESRCTYPLLQQVV